MADICYSFSNKKDYKEIAGIALRCEDGNIIITQKNDYLDLTEDFLPAWDLFPPAEEYFIQTTRGCPFSCNFCLNPNGRKVRQRTIASIVKEINFLIENFKPKRVSFGDESFAAEKYFANDLLDEMIKYDIGSKVNWDVQTHIRFINDDLLIKMKQAKVARIEVGVESGNEKTLKDINKGLDKKSVEDAFVMFKKYKIKSGAFFIFGHPNETKETLWETIKFAAKINPTEPTFGIMVPFPGTKINEYAKRGERGYRNLSNDWGKYRKQINGSVDFDFASHRKLKIYLVTANIYIFLYNLRFHDLIKFAYGHRKSFFHFIKR